ncbi:hypothetical protein HMPREF0281_01376 [Corynebacterium ammoniagenes DSM 20306]|uniref:Uncharacterized protein n=1 Tax=Corynebacterium ammoniagenes DSM 20306 TaxID=649754 RepID=A0ABP2IDJ6_CORAM|nr:hypothetical protein HMPREF0281_01376 [Corynebacterium ammoniagenes DSM 20306]
MAICLPHRRSTTFMDVAERLPQGKRKATQRRTSKQGFDTVESIA